MKPSKHQKSKTKIPRSTTAHNLLFCAHTLCMNYITNTFLLVGSSVRRKQLLCFVHRQGQKSEQKHKTENFVEFHDHSPLLPMVINLAYTSSNLVRSVEVIAGNSKKS